MRVRVAPGIDRKRVMAEYDRLNAMVNIYAGAANTVAGNAIFDTVCELRKRKWYRFRVKHCAEEALRCYYAYERRHTQNFGDRHGLFLDYLSEVEASVARDIQLLTYSIKAVMDRHGLGDTLDKARVETARALTELACVHFDQLMDNARRRAGFDFTPYFAAGRLTACLSWWREVADSVARTAAEGIRLCDDPNCKLAVSVIDSKLASDDLLNRAGYNALLLHTELIGKIDREEFEQLEKAYGNKDKDKDKDRE